MFNNSLRCYPHEVEKYPVIDSKSSLKNYGRVDTAPVIQFKLTNHFFQNKYLSPFYVVFRGEKNRIISYLKLFYFDEPSNQLYRLRTWGTHNAVYFPVDPENNGEFLPSKKIVFVFKVPLLDSASEDSPKRTMRLLNEDAPSECPNAFLSRDGMGIFIRYYDGIRNPSPKEVIKAIYDYFLKTNRIALDGLITGNVILYKDDQGHSATILIDRGDAFLFFPPNNPNASLVSLEVLPNKLYLYLDFFRNKKQNGLCLFEKTLCFTQALIALNAFELELKFPDAFLQQTALIQCLADLVEGSDLDKLNKFEKHFTPDSLKNMRARDTFSSQLAQKFRLSPRAKAFLRLNPALYFYEEPFDRLYAIFPDMSENLCFYFIKNYYFLSKNFSHLLILLSALPDGVPDQEIINLTNYIDSINLEKRHYFAYFFLTSSPKDLTYETVSKNYCLEINEFLAENEDSEIWFTALELFQERYKLSPHEARDTISEMSDIDDLKFLIKSYPYGMRKVMLERYDLAYNRFRQNKIMALFSAIEINYMRLSSDERKIELHRILSLTDTELNAELRRLTTNTHQTTSRFFVSAGLRPASRESQESPVFFSTLVTDQHDDNDASSDITVNGSF